MNRKISLELIWWLFTALICFLVLAPILFSTSFFYFQTVNIVFIVVFITLTRYIFLLQHTFLGQLTYVKVGLIFLAPIVIFLIIQEINRFQTFLDENGWEAAMIAKNGVLSESLTTYTHSEILLFGVGSVISAILFPIRMIVSIWRERNRGTV